MEKIFDFETTVNYQGESYAISFPIKTSFDGFSIPLGTGVDMRYRLLNKGVSIPLNSVDEVMALLYKLAATHEKNVKEATSNGKVNVPKESLETFVKNNENTLQTVQKYFLHHHEL